MKQTSFDTQSVETLQLIRFFNTFELADCRNYLWTMFKGLMSSDEADDWSAEERSRYLYFYESIEELLEILHAQQST